MHSLVFVLLAVLAVTHLSVCDGAPVVERDLLSYPSLAKLLSFPHRSGNGKRADVKTCTVFHCAMVGDTCGTVQLSNSTVETDCNGNNVCNITSSGSDGTESGKCLPIPGPGQSCAGTKACIDGYKCDSASHICVADNTTSYTTGPGTACNLNKDCYYLAFINHTLMMTDECIDGVCRFTPDGQQCNFAGAQCNGLTSFCNTTDNTCHKNLKDGDSCTVFQAGCADVCIPLRTDDLTGYCGAFYTSAIGKYCAYDSDCVEGALCVYASGDQIGTCKAPKNSTTLHTPCTSDSNCNTANMEYCGCDARYGTSPICVVDITPVGYTAAYDSLQTCTSYSGCTLPNGDVNTTCLFSVCLSEACNLYKIIGTTYDTSPNCFVKNTLLPMCASSTTPAPPTGSATEPAGTTSSASVVSVSLLLYIIYVLVL